MRSESSDNRQVETRNRQMDRRRLPVPDCQIIVRCVTGTVRTLMTATTTMRSRISTRVL